jgi:hypothetical protein
VVRAEEQEFFASFFQRRRPFFMRYCEVDFFGVFVSPLAAMMLAAWVGLVAVRRVADLFGAWQLVWHPALASLAVYVILLSLIVIGVGR